MAGLQGHNARTGKQGFQPITAGATSVPTAGPEVGSGGVAVETPEAPDLDAMLARARNKVEADSVDTSLGMDIAGFRGDFESGREKVAFVLSEFEVGVENVKNSESYKEFLDFQAKFHKYSWRNTLLIYAQCPNASMISGWHGWKKLGRHVKKGEKSIVILRPVTKKQPVLDANGNPVLDEKGKPKHEYRIARTKDGVPLFTTAPVFDVSQTDGDPVPEGPAKVLTGEAPPGYQDKLEEAIQAQGYTVERKKLPDGLNGATDPKTKVVYLSDSLEPAQVAKTTAHELAHILADHVSDLESYHTGHGGCRGLYEREAESVAYVLCKDAGMDTSDYSFGYVAGWDSTNSSADKEPNKAFKDSLDRSTKAIKKAFELLYPDAK